MDIDSQTKEYLDAQITGRVLRRKKLSEEMTIIMSEVAKSRNIES